MRGAHLAVPHWLAERGILRHGSALAGRARFTIEHAVDGWARLRDHRPVGPANGPGLWKTLARTSPERVFDLPGQILAEDPGDEQPLESMAIELLDWALATATGSVPDTWQAPAASVIDALVPKPARVVRAGAFRAELQIDAVAGRFSVRLPVASLSATPTTNRRRWLRHALALTQRSFRMVRLVHGPQAVHAEVNLSGAGPDLVSALLPVAVAALGSVGTALGSITTFLVDPVPNSRAIEILRPEPGEER